MKTLNEYVEGFATALINANLGEKSVRMDIYDVGSIHIASNRVSTEAKNADCILSTDHETYDQMFTGMLDPTIAFGQGKLKMDGDMGVALLMPPLFKKANS